MYFIPFSLVFSPENTHTTRTYFESSIQPFCAEAAMRPILIFSIVFLLFSTAGFAQTDDIPDKFSLQGSFGTVTKDGVQWQRFSFRPDIPIGKFGVGLDIELFVDEEGKISDEGWDFSNRNRTWDTIIRKIYYVRYGRPLLDKVYVRAGALDNVTLGYGLIMDGYCNTLDYPAEKKLGVDFGMRDVGTFGIGVEAMLNSVGDLKNDGIVAGTRVSFRPLKPYGANLLNRMTVGATFVRDVNQFAGLKDSDDDGYPDYQDGFPDDKSRFEDSDGDGFEDAVDIDVDGDNVLDFLPSGVQNDQNIERQDYINIRENMDGVSVWGLDLGLPLIESENVRLDFYGQYANIRTGDEDIDGGWGTGIPGMRLIIGPFLGQIEYRHFEGNFRHSYFDNLYEHERVRLVGTNIITKEQDLLDDTLNGVYGKAGYRFMDFFSAEAGYQFMKGDNTYQDVTGTAKVLPGLLDNVPKLTVLEAFFYNRFVDPDEYGLFEFSPNTYYGTRIGVSLTSGMSVVWSTRYTFDPKPDGGLERNRFVSIETVITMK